MRLASRVQRLEEGTKPGTCKVCGGKGLSVLSYKYEEEPDPEPKAGCPACGEVQHILIVFKDESLPGMPVVKSPRTHTAEELGRLFA